MVEFPCPHCGARLRLPAHQAGMRGRCPSCKSSVAVPHQAASSEAITAESPVPAPTTAITTADQVLPRYPAEHAARRKASQARAKEKLLARLRNNPGCMTPIVLSVAASAALFCLVYPVCQQINMAANRVQTQNNMKQIAFACHAYHDMHGGLPSPKMIVPNGGKTVELSWRVSILAFMEQKALFDQFDQTSDWDRPRNQPLLNSMPGAYAHPVRGAGDPRNTTTYFQYLTGPNTLWPANKPVVLREIPDGASHTLLFAEAAKSVPWSQAMDIAIHPNQPIPLPPIPLFVCFADGHVRQFYRDDHVIDATLRMAIDPSDGAVLPPDFGL